MEKLDRYNEIVKLGTLEEVTEAINRLQQSKKLVSQDGSEQRNKFLYNLRRRIRNLRARQSFLIASRVNIGKELPKIGDEIDFPLTLSLIIKDLEQTQSEIVRLRTLIGEQYEGYQQDAHELEQVLSINEKLNLTNVRNRAIIDEIRHLVASIDGRGSLILSDHAQHVLNQVKNAIEGLENYEEEEISLIDD